MYIIFDENLLESSRHMYKNGENFRNMYQRMQPARHAMAFKAFHKFKFNDTKHDIYLIMRT